MEVLEETGVFDGDTVVGSAGPVHGFHTPVPQCWSSLSDRVASGQMGRGNHSQGWRWTIGCVQLHAVSRVFMINRFIGRNSCKRGEMLIVLQGFLLILRDAYPYFLVRASLSAKVERV